MISTHTYKQTFYPDSLTFELVKESGRIYSKALALNKNDKNIKEIEKEMQEYCKKNTKYLHSQSAQAAYQSFIINLKSYFKALKEYEKNPSKFSGKPKPPHKNKFMYKITFKKAAIRYKEGNLLLSIKKPHEPIKVKWAKHLPIPTWVIISYDKFEGWNINFVMEKEIKHLNLDKNKIMSIDLGVKRVATTFDTVSKQCTTYNGKELMSLVRLRNKVDAKCKSKKSNYKKGSRKHKRISRANRRIVKRIKNKQNDILHKMSRMIVNDCIKKGIGRIIIGDSSGTHNKTNLGKENQKVQQNPEQKLKRFIIYKFESVGGTTEVVPEPYTSRECIKCENIKSSSPKGRTYSCDIVECSFEYDRDGIGCVNILKKNSKNASFDRKYWLDVVGGLTPPKGVKYDKYNTSGLSLAQKTVKSGKSKIRDSETKVEESISRLWA